MKKFEEPCWANGIRQDAWRPPRRNVHLPANPARCTYAYVEQTADFFADHEDEVDEHQLPEPTSIV
jgi:hypothetical protein